MPSVARSSRADSLSSSRSTTRSPAPVGSVDTRTSTCRSPSFSAMRPSCGSRFSAMSRLAMILRRDTSAPCSARGGSIDVAQHAVDAKAHDRARFVRLEVQVGRALAQRLQQQRVDHPDHRRLRAAVEQVLARRHVLHQPREIGLVREAFAHRERGARLVVGARELGGERLGVDGARDERAVQHAAQLGDAVDRRIGPQQHDDGVAFVAPREHAVRARERIGNARARAESSAVAGSGLANRCRLRCPGHRALRRQLGLRSGPSRTSAGRASSSSCSPRR